jgi:hypothetical protein
MFWQFNVLLGGVDDSLGAFPQGVFELFEVLDKPRMFENTDNRDDIAGFRIESMCKLFIVGYQMNDINVASVFVGKHVLPDLVSANY